MKHCIVLSVILIICLQRSHVFQWDGKSAVKWLKVDVKLELPKDTILEVEFVQELRGEVNLRAKLLLEHLRYLLAKQCVAFSVWEPA